MSIDLKFHWDHPTYPITLNDQSKRNLYVSPGYWYEVSSADGLWDQDVRFEAHDLPQQHGSASGDAFYTGRTIVLAGRVIAKDLTLLRVAQRALQAAFYDMTPNPLRFTMWGETEVYVTCRKNQKLDMPEEQLDIGPNFKRAFTLQLYADDPHMYVVGTNTVYLAYS